MTTDRKLSLNNILHIIQIAAFFAAGIAWYFTGYTEVVRLLDKHDIRIEYIEKIADRNQANISDLYQSKADK